MMTLPESSPGSTSPRSVTSGRRALRNACFQSACPPGEAARARRERRSRRSRVSATLERTSRAKNASEPYVRQTTGSASVRGAVEQARALRDRRIGRDAVERQPAAA